MSRPPRYRPIRTALWAIYLVLAFGFVGLVVAAVVRGVLGQHVAAKPGTSASRANCAAELARIYRSVHQELDAERRAVGQDDAQAEAHWAPLRARLKTLAVECDFKRRRSEPLSKAYRKVRALQRLAESASVQYRHEVGPTDLAARKLLVQAGAAPQGHSPR